MVGASASSAPRTAKAETLVAYVDAHDQDVWVADVSGGAKRRIGPGQSTLVSPSGRYVAASETSGGVTIYPTSGGKPHTFHFPSGDGEPLAWSEDSTYVAIGVSSTKVSSEVGAGLEVIDTATMKATKVASGVIEGASFRPDPSDRLVYGRAPSLLATATVNLTTVNPDGAHKRNLTSNGRSLDPVWGPAGIAYDIETFRNEPVDHHDPAAQIWILANSGKRTKLTDVAVGELSFGLVPVGFDRAGTRLLAEYQQQDNPQPWVVSVPSGKAHEVTITGAPVAFADGISASGARFIFSTIYTPYVATVSVSGGKPTVLSKDADGASWNA